MSKAAELAALIGGYGQGSPLTGRNMIVNGAFQVDQKNRTSTATGSGGSKFVDGWRQGQSNVGQLSVESSRTADAPSSFQGNYSCKIQVKTVESSLDANEDYSVYTNIEGFDCAKLQYGTASAKKTTLSFWVKSSIAGTFACNLYMPDGAMAIAQPYTISSADTWEYKTLTWAANTGQAITIDNTPGLQVQWMISVGSNSTGGSDGDEWHTWTANKWAFGHTTNTHVTTDESTFQLTGVQFEIGDVATNYEHLPYDAELAKCQRYLFVPKAKGDATSKYFGTALYYSSSQMQVYIPHPVDMRASPTVTVSDGSNHFAMFRESAGDYVDTIPLNSASTSMTGLYNSDDASGTAGNSGGFLANNQNDAYIYIDSFM